MQKVQYAVCPISKNEIQLSNMGEKIDMHRTKTSYIINHGLAPCLKTNKSDILVLSFDESLNQNTQSGQMESLYDFGIMMLIVYKVDTLDPIFLGMLNLIIC